MNLTTIPPPKTRKVYQTEFATAHRACHTPLEREQLAEVIQAGWAEAELYEYARLFFFPNNKDYPTPLSYRRAIKSIASYQKWMPPLCDTEPSYLGPIPWLKLFRRGKSKPLPPRRAGLLLRGKGMPDRINYEEYSWPGHTEDYRSMIEQRCRDYFKIAPDQPVHVNAWAASKQAYDREERELWMAAEDANHSLLAKALKKSPPKGYKVVSSFSYIGRSFPGGSYTESTLQPYFEREFKGHTPEFREEVDALARKDNHLKPRASVSRARWKAACHKHFVLIKRTQA